MYLVTQEFWWKHPLSLFCVCLQDNFYSAVDLTITWNFISYYLRTASHEATTATVILLMDLGNVNWKSGRICHFRHQQNVHDLMENVDISRDFFPGPFFHWDTQDFTALSKCWCGGNSIGTSFKSGSWNLIAWVWLSPNDGTSVEKSFFAQVGYGGMHLPSLH